MGIGQWPVVSLSAVVLFFLASFIFRRDIASYHSGDSDDNSSDPIVVPNTSSKKRKARGQNVLVDLEERRAKSSVPLPLEVDVVSSKIVGKESITFPRLIGREVRLHVPGWYHSWASVPQQHQDLVLSRVKHYYEIDNNEHASTILQITLAEMADKYKKRKSLRHAHFKKFYKKPEDFEQAVDNPPNDVNAEHWRQICQFFTSPEFIARSQQNKNNREKSKYPTTQGSKSLAGMRSENRNVGYIETWKEAHINKKTKTFVNENARRDYERLKAAYEKRASIPNSGPVDEIAILREVLGERRGHNRGVGRKLKGQSSTHRTQPVPTQQMPMDPRVERELARLRRKIQHMSQKLAPEDRLPSDDEIVDMGPTHPIGPSQTHMSTDLANIQKKKEEEKALKDLKAKAQQKGAFGGSGLKKSGKK
uniref:Uncharacterized protein n=1 Tax=Cannabis sativa TaxID=3483 RepID=A0A803NZW9_CANSA